MFSVIIKGLVFVALFLAFRNILRVLFAPKHTPVRGNQNSRVKKNNSDIIDAEYKVIK